MIQKELTALGEDADAKRLGDYLLERAEHVVTAESCTGGLIGGALTSVVGSSQWFDQGWITYTNRAKHEQLGVSKETLKAFGAVSEQVAKQMASGALAMAPRANLALAVTGIAGPGGGSVDKPVGLVWFGFACRRGSEVVVSATHQIFEGDRQAVRAATVQFSLRHALAWLKQDQP